MHRTPNSGFFLSISFVAPVIRALAFKLKNIVITTSCIESMEYFASYDFYLIGKGLNVEECESKFGLMPHVCLLEGDEIRHKSSGKFLRIQDKTVWGFTSAEYVESHIPKVHEKWLFEVISKNKCYISDMPDSITPFFEISIYLNSSVVIGKEFINLSQCIGAEIGVLSRKS